MEYLSMVTVALVVDLERADRPVDGDFVEIRPAQADQLRVQVGEETSLHQRIVGEIDSRDDVGHAVSDLFRFGEKVVRISKTKQKKKNL